MNNICKNMKEVEEKFDQDQQQRSFKIFLGSLPPKTTKAIVRKIFEEFGQIKAIYLQFNNKNNFCKGSGYIVLEEEEAFNKILKTDIAILGRKIFKEPFLRGRKLKKKKVEFSSKRIFVTDIPAEISDMELKEIFKKFGAVEQAYRITCCNGSKQPYGFVLFKNSSSAKKCHQAKMLEINGGITLNCRLFENKDSPVGFENQGEVYVKKSSKKGKKSKEIIENLEAEDVQTPPLGRRINIQEHDNMLFGARIPEESQKLRKKNTQICPINFNDGIRIENETSHYPKIDQNEYLNSKIRKSIDRNHQVDNISFHFMSELRNRLNLLRGHNEYYHGRRIFF